jgi:predicted TIM-barrel fold metal-dependent hydrolase
MNVHTDGVCDHGEACQRAITLDRRRFLVGMGAVGLTALGARRGHAATPAHRIDVHHHIIPPQYLKEAPPSADFQRALQWTPEKAVADMDRNGVATAMLSFSAPYLWFAGIEPGRRLARLCNDYCAQLMRDHPGRFGLFAGVPPLSDTEGALKEIDYAYGTLKADGITVMTSYADQWLGDAAFVPVWDELNRRQAVVFVHPSIPGCCNALSASGPAGYGELPFDTARAILSLWGTGGLVRWPNIHFIFSHGGGALPMVADRADKFGRAAGPGGPPMHDGLVLFRRLYFDVANAANPIALPATRALAAPDHILFGTDYPYIPIDRAVNDLGAAPLNPQELRAIERDNAVALIPRLKNVMAAMTYGTYQSHAPVVVQFE